MSDPFIAEIKMFGGNFAPRGFSFCNGALLPVAQNTALFSLIGTIYGGDGETTTRLPDLQGRTPVHWGNGPGLTPRPIGQQGGLENVTLNETQMPAHNHSACVSLAPPNNDDPTTDAILAAGATTATKLYGPGSLALDGKMATQALPNHGGSQSHNNQQPYLAVSFIIALTGTYPTPS